MKIPTGSSLPILAAAVATCRALGGSVPFGFYGAEAFAFAFDRTRRADEADAIRGRTTTRRLSALRAESSTTTNLVPESRAGAAAQDEIATTSRRDALTSAAASILGLASAACTGAPAPTLAVDEESSSYRVELKVRLDPTSVGIIELEVYPSWAPLAASRFRELVETGYYDGSRFHRVLPGYVAQFGLSPDPALNKEWLFCEKNCRALVDEPRTQSNARGTLSFASSGKNSRQTQVFINLGNNGGPPNFLDGQGFVPFGRVTGGGMDEVVSKLNSEYGLLESVSGGVAGSVNQLKAAYYGKEYLDAKFPKLSYIETARVL